MIKKMLLEDFDTKYSRVVIHRSCLGLIFASITFIRTLVVYMYSL